MSRTLRRISFLLLTCLLSTSVLAGEAEKPSSDAPPADPPPQTQSIAKGAIEFTPPNGWIFADKSSTPTRAVYISDTREGAILIESRPDSQLAADSGPQLVKKLQAMRENAHTTVMAAELEPDDTVDIRIHERYKQGERVADQLHLYKKFGQRVVMVTVNSLSDDEERTKAIHDAGLAVMASAKYTPPARKQTPKPPARKAN